ncbi:DUF1643 domain-containing protein [Bacillus salipaludis]|uniref:DUF1643 domain-containing protein n=1 Tax=Bacillus salipaludis TaxID=2547811 RepID=UPI002E2131F1|nr:DUF1643 domain-containing protein [Bacillus salipaludis]
MHKDAVLKGIYRYSLIRTWDIYNSKKVVFIMLNPSTADAYEDDRTTKRCIGFAKTWGAGSLEIVNVFAYRATQHDELRNLTIEEATGPENWDFVKKALSEATIKIAAWGENVRIHYRQTKDLMSLFEIIFYFA